MRVTHVETIDTMRGAEVHGDALAMQYKLAAGGGLLQPQARIGARGG